MTRLEHEVFDFSTAGKQAVDARITREMRCYEDQNGRPISFEDKKERQDVCIATAADVARENLRRLCDSFENNNQPLDHEVLGAHLLDRWREELLEYGVSCGYSKLRVKELQTLCELRDIPADSPRKGLVR